MVRRTAAPRGAQAMAVDRRARRLPASGGAGLCRRTSPPSRTRCGPLTVISGHLRKRLRGERPPRPDTNAGRAPRAPLHPGLCPAAVGSVRTPPGSQSAQSGPHPVSNLRSGTTTRPIRLPRTRPAANRRPLNLSGTCTIQSEKRRCEAPSKKGGEGGWTSR